MITQQNIQLELDKYYEEVQRLKEVADSFEMMEADSVTNALNLAFQAKSLHKRIEDKRKQIIEPARSFVTKINFEAAKFTEVLDSVVETFINKIDEWKSISDLVLFREEPEYKTDQYTLCERKDFEIVVEDISKIPVEYLKVDEAKLKLLAKSGVRDIPGIRIERTSKSYLKSDVG